MTETAANMIVSGAGVYLAVGVLLALAFVFHAIARLDDAADGASIWFRLLIFSGAALLWPVVLVRWLTGRRINQPINAKSDTPDGREAEAPR